MEDRYQRLIDKITSQGYLFNENLIKTFRNTPRKNYLPKLYKKMDCINSPLPLKDGQTTSQPLTIAFMLELLSLQQNQKVLEIGFGSGWQTAIIAKFINSQLLPNNTPTNNAQNNNTGTDNYAGTRTGTDNNSSTNNDKNSKNNNNAEIFAYEINPDIAKSGSQNLKNNLTPELLDTIHLYKKDFTAGFNKHKPYHRIISGAAFAKRPTELIKALSPGGVIVYPSQVNDIRRIIRDAEDPEKYTEESFPGFTFVSIRHKSSPSQSQIEKSNSKEG